MQVFPPSHSNFSDTELKLLGNSSDIGFPGSLAPLSPCLSQLKEKYRLTISKAAKSPEPKLYSRPVWLVPALQAAEAGSCLGQQTAGGSKAVRVPLPAFLSRIHGEGGCLLLPSPWAKLWEPVAGVHCLLRSRNPCLSSCHPRGWHLSQPEFCPLLTLPRQWGLTLVASPWGDKPQLHLHWHRALRWLCRRFSHVRSALYVQMRLRQREHGHGSCKALIWAVSGLHAWCCLGGLPCAVCWASAKDNSKSNGNAVTVNTVQGRAVSLLQPFPLLPMAFSLLFLFFFFEGGEITSFAEWPPHPLPTALERD